MCVQNPRCTWWMMRGMVGVAASASLTNGLGNQVECFAPGPYSSNAHFTYAMIIAGAHSIVWNQAVSSTTPRRIERIITALFVMLAPDVDVYFGVDAVGVDNLGAVGKNRVRKDLQLHVMDVQSLGGDTCHRGIFGCCGGVDDNAPHLYVPCIENHVLACSWQPLCACGVGLKGACMVTQQQQPPQRPPRHQTPPHHGLQSHSQATSEF